MSENKNAKIEEINFETAMKELENIVLKMEEGNIPLKESVDLYERGIFLKKQCNKILESVELRINKISSDKNNEVVIESNQMEI